MSEGCSQILIPISPASLQAAVTHSFGILDPLTGILNATAICAGFFCFRGRLPSPPSAGAQGAKRPAAAGAVCAALPPRASRCLGWSPQPRSLHSITHMSVVDLKSAYSRASHVQVQHCENREVANTPFITLDHRSCLSVLPVTTCSAAAQASRSTRLSWLLRFFVIGPRLKEHALQAGDAELTDFRIDIP